MGWKWTNINATLTLLHPTVKSSWRLAPCALTPLTPCPLLWRSYPPKSQPWPNPILHRAQASTKDWTGWRKVTTIVTGLNFKFMATHFKQILGVGLILLPSQLAFLLWENSRHPLNLQHTSPPYPDNFTYFTSKTETSHFNCLIFPPSSYLHLYTIYFLFQKLSKNHPSYARPTFPAKHSDPRTLSCHNSTYQNAVTSSLPYTSL